jgi:hypothetical protein
LTTTVGRADTDLEGDGLVEACAVVAVAFRTFARIFASGKPISLEEISLWPSTSSSPARRRSLHSA